MAQSWDIYGSELGDLWLRAGIYMAQSWEIYGSELGDMAQRLGPGSHLGLGPTWARVPLGPGSHLGPGPLGPGSHLGPGPTWARAHLDLGPTWARALSIFTKIVVFSKFQISKAAMTLGLCCLLPQEEDITLRYR